MTNEEQKLWDDCIRALFNTGYTQHVDNVAGDTAYVLAMANAVIVERRKQFPRQETLLGIARSLDNDAQDFDRLSFYPSLMGQGVEVIRQAAHRLRMKAAELRAIGNDQ